MKTAILIAVASGALALQLQPAHARIGENEAQITKRYGKALQVIHTGAITSRKYEFKGFTIMVSFDDKGVSRCETYRKIDSSAMRDGEIDVLLAANAGGSQWSKPRNSGVDKVYGTDDDKFAAYKTFQKSLTITTLPFLEVVDSTVSHQDQAALRGF